MMPRFIFGGTTNYGQVAGILMLDSVIPRLPGDPGHAATFDFPVRYGVVRDFPFEDLIDFRRDNLDNIIKAAVDCGLFSVFQKDIAAALSIPFIGSALNLLPLIAGFLPGYQKIGLITGDTRLLKIPHLEAAGADPDRLVVRGMENCEEFEKVVIQRRPKLDPEAMRSGVLAAAEELFQSEEPIGAVVLECTNLITFRSDIQRQFNVPVYDLVSLMEFFADGYKIKNFTHRYISADRTQR